MEKGVRLLDLAQNVVILYEKQEMQEKRRLLDFVCANLPWKAGKRMSVHEMSSESKWRETTVSGCKAPSVHGRTLGTCAQCSDG